MDWIVGSLPTYRVGSGRADGVEGAVVEGVGGQVGTVGPHDRAGLRVDGGLGEELDLAQGFEDGSDRSGELRLEVNRAYRAVGEGDPEWVSAQVFDGTDVVRSAHGNGSMLTSGCSEAARSLLANRCARWSSAHSATMSHPWSARTGIALLTLDERREYHELSDLYLVHIAGGLYGADSAGADGFGVHS